MYNNVLMREIPKFSVVIPVFNEEKNVPELYLRLTGVLNQLGTYEIIFIDDGSSDNSYHIMRNIAAKDQSVKVIKFSRNFGQHPAINAGFKYAQGENIILMDADLQDKPEDITMLYKKINEGYDIVFTRIGNIERPFFKKINSSIFHYVFSKLSASRAPSDIGTFRIFNRKFLRNIYKYRERKVVYGPLMSYVGFKSTYVTVDKNKRLQGETHYSFIKLLRLAIDSLSSYTMIPLIFMIYSGFLLAFMSFFAALFFIFKKIAFGIDVSGYASIMISIFFFSGIILLSLGIVGDYIYRIYQEVLQRPLFLVEEEINFRDSRGGNE